jgi:hypothetical protein
MAPPTDIMPQAGPSGRFLEDIMVYVDDARHAFGRMVMGHMLADSLEELHAMAHAIGMRRAWFQPYSFPHYDVSLQRRALALSLGAVQVDRRGIVAVKRRLEMDAAFRDQTILECRALGIAPPRFVGRA